MKLVTPRIAKLTARDHVAELEHDISKGIRALGKAIDALEHPQHYHELLKTGQTLHELQQMLQRLNDKLS